MAYVTKLDMGYPQALVQNTVYALPIPATRILTTANVNIANDVAMTSPFVVVATTGPASISGAFIQCTAATNCIVTLKRD